MIHWWVAHVHFQWKKEKPYARDTKISCPGQSVVHSAGCCGVNEQQHNQDLRESKAERILEFITFYQNALPLTRVQCGTFYQSGLRHFWPECIAPRTTQITRGNLFTESVHRSLLRLKSFLCGKFSTARLEVLPNLRHEGVFQMSTGLRWVWWSTSGMDFKSLWLVQALNLTRG